MTTALRKLWRILLAGMLLVVTGLLIALVAVPMVLGWVPLTVLSGSMEPSISTGSQVVIEPLETSEEIAQLTAGDIITFMPHPDDPTLITHRITAVGMDSTGRPLFTTQGDHNPSPDADVVMQMQIRGIVRYHVPFAGYLASALDREQKSYGVVILAAALGGYAVWHLAQAARSSRRRPPRATGEKRLVGERLREERDHDVADAVLVGHLPAELAPGMGAGELAASSGPEGLGCEILPEHAAHAKAERRDGGTEQ